MRRSADFITYPGTGMWMLVEVQAPAKFSLHRGISVVQIRVIVGAPSTYKLYWIDQGIGAATLLGVRNGGKSSSATEVTPSLLKRYLKEDSGRYGAVERSISCGGSDV